MPGEAEELAVLLTLRDQFSRQITQPLKKLRDFGKNFQVLGRSVKLASAVIAGGFALMAKNIVSTSAKLVQLNKITGFSIERIQKLGLAAEFSNSSMMAIQNGIKTLARAAEGANRGMKEYQMSFEALGVSVKDQSGNLRSLEAIFDDVIDGLSEMENQTEKAAVAQRLLSESGIELLPLIEGGTKGLKEIGKTAEDLGLIIKGETAESLEVFGNQLNTLKQAGKAFVAEGLLVIAKALPDIIETFFVFADAVNRVKNRIVQAFEDMNSEVRFAINVWGAFKKALLDDRPAREAVKDLGTDLKKAYQELTKEVFKNQKATEARTESDIELLEQLKRKIQGSISLISNLGNTSSKSLKEVSDSSQELLNVWTDLDNQTRKIDLTAKQTGDELRRLKERFDATNKVIEERIALAVEDGEVTFEEMKAIRELQTQLESARFSLEKYTAQMEKANKAQEDFENALAEVKSEATAAGIALTAEQMKNLAKFSIEAGTSVQELIAHLVAVGDNDPFIALSRAAEDFAGNMETLRSKFGRMFSSMQGAFANAFEGMMDKSRKWKDVLKDFFKDIQRSFMKMVADIVSQQLMKQVAGMFMGGGAAPAGGSAIGGGAAAAAGAGASLQTAGVGGLTFLGPAAQAAGGGAGAGGVLGLGAAGALIPAAGMIGMGITQQMISEGDVTGSTVSGVLSGAAMGAFAGPIGIAAGALIGGVTSFMGASSEEKKAKEAKRRQQEAIEEQKRRIQKAAEDIKIKVRESFRGGVAIPQAAETIGKLFSGDVTAGDVERLAEEANMIGQQARGLQSVNNVNIGPPSINVSVGNISGSYDVQNLAQDIGIHLRNELASAGA